MDWKQLLERPEDELHGVWTGAVPLLPRLAPLPPRMVFMTTPTSISELQGRSYYESVRRVDAGGRGG